ncbi:1-(5-phosphoribosyl)-5-[(5-phosphoribosylamino)methylideneamino]imidazole-4-carboxamide isomerase [Dethiobacter alkaliphilus]|uniref:1-(5-phosphoribosyl)-5-[(5- phosphoribosylamino)methylideneamino]imidazole-4- carboxamide isomerase n=1 Tax=Dethiobacter alkaliphilus TaxID=427926 RepID=UPI002227006D|nr:1-(5-phosphoribosyl)-5-[(5-phosphoribosylamino)methylideneamino]imidazole-4-carboxamide isomerase [Dethiobacter alkaliphilus]MCW3491288.1 1-(5-phosphoribosyl)-5-[(5-phosphoribosylamino)methylideneamino]imidazole-4-carboxamide isomerase [Dethiobacter alkaliphilus]
MLIIPAVDIRDGRCVRLVHGELDKETVYHEDPVEAAKRWEKEGAGRLHLVDLDGAFEGAMKNADIIERIVQAVKIPVQVGGGIRDVQTAADLLKRGVARVILGTVAVTEPDVVQELCKKYPGQIVVGIDAKNGYVAIRGWVEESKEKAIDLALRMAELGVEEIVYTDIHRDGTLQGPNLEALQEMAEAVPLGVIASGGVSSLEDISNLQKLEQYGVSAVIMGQALYTGNVNLAEALKITEER